MRKGDAVGVLFDDGHWYNGVLTGETDALGRRQIFDWDDSDPTPIWLDGTRPWVSYKVARDGSPKPIEAADATDSEVKICTSKDSKTREKYYVGGKWTVKQLKEHITILSKKEWEIKVSGKLKADLITALVNATPRKPKLAFMVLGKRTLPSGAVEIEVKWNEGDDSNEWVQVEKVQNSAILLQAFEDGSKASGSEKQAEDQYVPERIIGQRVVNGTMKYKIVWKGYPESEATEQTREDLQDKSKDGHLQKECEILTAWETKLRTRNYAACKASWVLKLDESNLHVSCDCKECCRWARDPLHLQKIQTQREAVHAKVPQQQRIRISMGGDMSGLGDFFGIKKLGSCHFNSHISLASKADQQQGMPQGPVWLAKYAAFAAQSTTSLAPAIRTLESMHKQGKAQAEADAKVPAQVIPVDSNGSMAGPPLIKHGDMEDIAPIPVLHVDMGFATKIVNEIDADVHELDEQAQAIAGKVDENGSGELHMDAKETQARIEEEEAKKERLERKITYHEESKEAIKEKNPAAFSNGKDGHGRRSDAAKKYEDARADYADHNESLKTYKAKLQDAKRQLKVGHGRGIMIHCMLLYISL